MKQFKILFGIILVGILLITITSIYWPLKDTYGSETVYQVDISTTPASGFLNAENMAPEDEVTSLLMVKNNGNLDFNYTISSFLQSGVDDMYNKLMLKVFDSQGLLYEGTLSGLQDFPLGTIAKGGCNNLTFSAALPKDVGNELQDKCVSVAFNFNAVAHDQQVPVGDECFEPPFSNNQFTLHQKSTVPIKFHLRNAAGELESSPRDKVRLEITGPGINGGSVNYIFSMSNGKLKFDNSVEESHYLVRFSTFEYPVKTGCTYKATVYDDSQILYEKVFEVKEQGNRSNAP